VSCAAPNHSTSINSLPAARELSSRRRSSDGYTISDLRAGGVVHSLLQAILAVDDLHVTAKEDVFQFFREDVEEFLRAQTFRRSAT